MNISCNVIKDLLPLYHDEVCSKESADLVERHVETCESCKEELDKYKIEINDLSFQSQSDIKEARVIGNLSKKWKRDKRRSFLLGTILVSVIGCIFSISSYISAGSYVAEDGTLVEAFGFIPLAYLFGLIALVASGVLGITSLSKALRRN